MSHALTVNFDHMAYIPQQTPSALEAAGKKIDVIEYPGGEIVLRHKTWSAPRRSRRYHWSR